MEVPPTSLRWDFFDGMLEPSQARNVYINGAIPIVMADFVVRHAIVVRAAVILGLNSIEVHTVAEHDEMSTNMPSTEYG